MPALWTGVLTFGLVEAPVQLFPGPRGRRIQFHLLHASDQVRLRQQMICPRHEQAVASDEIVRGFEVAPDEYVVLDPEEIRQAAPPSRQQLEVVKFCHAAEIDPLWFESACYLMPASGGSETCALLQQALEQTDRVAVCRLSLRQRESMAVVRPTRLGGVPDFEPGAGTRPRRHGLMLHTLYYADEIRVAEGFGEPAGEAAVPAAQLDLACRLIDALTRPFAPESFHDRYRENLERAIAARRQGRRLRVHRPPPPPVPARSLLQSLQESVEQIQAPPRKPPSAAPEAPAQLPQERENTGE